MPDVDDGFDAQDGAEAYDESHRGDEMVDGEEDRIDTPDLDEDVYDVTSALGDADDDEDPRDADDYDAEELDELDLDDEEAADEDEDDDLDDDLESEAESNADGASDHRVDRAAGRAAPVEPGLHYAADLDAITNPRDDDVEKYETSRPLSDEQLADLGYGPRSQDKET